MRFCVYLKCCVTLCALFVGFPLSIASGSLVITSMPGTTHEADGYSNFATTSADMIGLEIMVYFADGSSDLGIWTTSGVSQNNWSISQGVGQSTFNFPFDMTNNSNSAMTRFTMHGRGSSTIFDRAVLPGTTGTATGRDLREFTNLQFSQNIAVTYFDQIQTVGSTPQNDIFAGMDVSFSAGISSSGGLFRFRTDTDNTVNTVRATIPEVSSVIQFGLLMSAFQFRRRRKPVW